MYFTLHLFILYGNRLVHLYISVFSSIDQSVCDLIVEERKLAVISIFNLKCMPAQNLIGTKLDFDSTNLLNDMEQHS